MSPARHTTGAVTTGKTALLFVAVLALVSLAACGRNASTVVQSPLTNSSFSNVPVGTGNNPEPGNTSQPEPSQTGHSESILAGNGVAYVGSDNGRLYALNADTGKVEWQLQLGGWVRVFAVNSGVVYASSAAVYAVSATSGQLLWQFHHAGADEYFVAVGSGTVVASTSASGNHFTVYGLQAASGHLVWQYTTSSYFPGLLGVVNGVVYTTGAASPDPSGGNSSLTALDAASGQVIWQLGVQASDGAIAGPPLESSGILYAATTTGAVYALRPATGTVLWHVSGSRNGGGPPPPGPDRYSPIVADGLVYSGNESGVSAYQASNGAQVWHYQQLAIGPFAPDPVLVSGVLYVGINGLVAALNPSTGAVLWQDQAKGPIIGSVLVADGVVITGSTALYGLNASDGSQIWKAALPQAGSGTIGAAGSQALGGAASGDVVYVGAGSGVVNALSAATGKQLWQFAISEPLVPTALIYGADITFKPGTTFIKALLDVTSLGLKTFWECTPQWTNLTGRWSHFSSLDLTVNATVASAPLWYDRLKALPEVANVFATGVMGCPEETLTPGAPNYLPVQQAGTYVKVTFASGDTYNAALEAVDGLGFRLAAPCYEQARAAGDKPTWQSLNQAGGFTTSHSLILATTQENATIWLQQLHALSGVQSVNAPYTASC